MVDTQQNQRATWKADGAALLTTLLLPVAFLWPAATGRALLAHQDICFFFEPAMALLRDALRHGRLPLWSPYIFGGYPVAATGPACSPHCGARSSSVSVDSCLRIPSTRACYAPSRGFRWCSTSLSAAGEEACSLVLPRRRSRGGFVRSADIRR
jgi:hypothetical protein